MRGQDRVAEGRLEEALRRHAEGLPPAVREGIRGRVLAEARARSVASGQSSQPFARLVALFAAVSLTIGGTSVAAGNALPGDALYPLKRAMEEVRVQLTPASMRGDALVDVARERVHEVNRLMERDAAGEHIDSAVQGFLEAARRAVEEESDRGEIQERERELQESVVQQPAPVRERVEYEQAVQGDGDGTQSESGSGGETPSQEYHSPGPGEPEDDAGGSSGTDGSGGDGSDSQQKKQGTP